MGLLDKYNKNVNKFEYQQVENPKYYKLQELVENGKTEVNVLGMFINTKSRFGEHGVLVADGYNINLPNHLNDTIKEMINDDEIVELTNKGNLGIQIYQYQSNWGTNYSVEFIELNQDIPF